MEFVGGIEGIANIMFESKSLRREFEEQKEEDGEKVERLERRVEEL